MPTLRSAGSEARAVAGAITSMRIDDLIFHLAAGIADGQGKLDDVCMEIAAFMGEPRIAFGKKAGTGESDMVSLLELGFAPNFYQFVDSILEVKVSISSTYEESYERGSSTTRAYKEAKAANSAYGGRSSTKTTSSSGGGFLGSIFGGTDTKSASRSSSYSSSRFTEKNTRLNLTTVDAKYSSTYNFSVEGSSSVKTKIVPIPPPTLLEERIRMLLEEQKEEDERLENLGQIKMVMAGIIEKCKALGGKKIFGDEYPESENSIINATTPTKANIDADSGKLKMKIDIINEVHTGITDAQWAVVGNITYRQNADQYILGLVSNAEIVASSDPEISDELTSAKAAVVNIKTDLKNYCELIQEILDSLPLTEEEKLKQENPEGG